MGLGNARILTDYSQKNSWALISNTLKFSKFPFEILNGDPIFWHATLYNGTPILSPSLPAHASPANGQRNTNRPLQLYWPYLSFEVLNWVAVAITEPECYLVSSEVTCRVTFAIILSCKSMNDSKIVFIWDCIMGLCICTSRISRKNMSTIKNLKMNIQHNTFIYMCIWTFAVATPIVHSWCHSHSHNVKYNHTYAWMWYCVYLW